MMFSTKLRRARKGAGLTQTDLSRIVTEMGITLSRSAVAFWETPKTDDTIPKVPLLEAMARALEVNPAWLGPEGEPVHKKTQNQSKSPQMHFQPKDDILRVAQSKNSNIITTTPILHLNQIGAWLSTNSNVINKKGRTMITEQEMTQPIFGYLMDSDAMFNLQQLDKSIRIGEEIIFDPIFENGIKSGDVVLAEFGTDDYKVRIFYKDGSTLHLRALNPAFEAIQIDSEDSIVAKALRITREI